MLAFENEPVSGMEAGWGQSVRLSVSDDGLQGMSDDSTV